MSLKFLRDSEMLCKRFHQKKGIFSYVPWYQGKKLMIKTINKAHTYCQMNWGWMMMTKMRCREWKIVRIDCWGGRYSWKFKKPISYQHFKCNCQLHNSISLIAVLSSSWLHLNNNCVKIPMTECAVNGFNVKSSTSEWEKLTP